MARKFTLQIIMDLASRIGANPGKAISRSNVSFFGTGPKNNPLFQNRLAGLENASAENLGDPKNLFGAIEDAVGWMKDGKLNSIQSEILGHNLSGINKVLNPPVLPSATITTLPRSGLQPRSDWANQKQGSGITGVKRLIKEGKIEDAWRKFDKGYKGNPADEKYFESFHPEAYKDSTKSKFFEGPITTTGPKGTRTWDFTKKSKLPEPGPFQGWKPSVVPKVNIPASKINHQIIADQYGIDVELIEGKDWVEVLEVIRKLGLRHGGLARILEV